MQVTLKLFASLGRYLPVGAKRNVAKVDVDDETTIQSLLDQFQVPSGSCHLVLLNGVFQAPEVRSSANLSEGDEVAVWPPVAGG